MNAAMLLEWGVPALLFFWVAWNSRADLRGLRRRELFQHGVESEDFGQVQRHLISTVRER